MIARCTQLSTKYVGSDADMCEYLPFFSDFINVPCHAMIYDWFESREFLGIRKFPANQIFSGVTAPPKEKIKIGFPGLLMQS